MKVWPLTAACLSLSIAVASATFSEAAEAENLLDPRGAVKHLRARRFLASGEVSDAISLVQTSSSSERGSRLNGGTHVFVRGLKKSADLNGHQAEVVKFDEKSQRYIVKMDTGVLKSIKQSHLEITKDGEEDGSEKNEEGSAHASSGHKNVYSGAGGATTRQQTKEQIIHDPRLWPVTSKGEHMVEGSQVVLNGLKSVPELNGRTGTVQYFDATSGRFLVTLPGPSEPPRRVTPAHLSLASTGAGDVASRCKGAGSQEDGPDGLGRGMGVIIHGLKSPAAIKAGWNGQTATIHCYDKMAGRFVVEMADGSPKEIRSANLVLQPDPVKRPAMQPPAEAHDSEQDEPEEASPALPAVASLMSASPVVEAAPPQTFLPVVHAAAPYVPAPPQVAAPAVQVAPVASEVDEVIDEKAAAAKRSWQEGAKAELIGLKNSVFNGQVVEVQHFDEKAGRYKVIMSDGTEKRVRASHLKSTNNNMAPKLTVCNTYSNRDNIKVASISSDKSIKDVKLLRPQACFGTDAFPTGHVAFFSGEKELLRVPIDLSKLSPEQGRELTIYRKSAMTGAASIHDNTVELKDEGGYYLHLINAYTGSKKPKLLVKRGDTEKILPLDRSYRMDKYDNIQLTLVDGLKRLKMAFKPQQSRTYCAVVTGADAEGPDKFHTSGMLLHELGAWTSAEQLNDQTR